MAARNISWLYGLFRVAGGAKFLGCFEGWEGTLALLPGIGTFLVKDIVLFAASVWIAGASLTELRLRRGNP